MMSLQMRRCYRCYHMANMFEVIWRRCQSARRWMSAVMAAAAAITAGLAGFTSQLDASRLLLFLLAGAFAAVAAAPADIKKAFEPMQRHVR
jgi:hypothetical protein